MQKAAADQDLVIVNSGNLIAAGAQAFRFQAMIQVNNLAPVPYLKTISMRAGDPTQTISFEMVDEKLKLNLTALRVAQDKTDYAVMAYKLSRTSDDLKTISSQFIVVVDLKKMKSSAPLVTKYSDFNYPVSDDWTLEGWVANNLKAP